MARKEEKEMYRVRLDKHRVEFGARRAAFATLESLYAWIAQTYGAKVKAWVLEEDCSGGEKMPPIDNVSYFLDVCEVSVDLEGWLKVVEGGCDAYFFHITKD
jgi:hypothetical protein